MSNLIVKFWQGFMRSENMDNPEWLSKWKESVKKAEDKNEIFVVFKIKSTPLGMPKGHEVEDIERYLQNLYNEEKS